MSEGASLAAASPTAPAASEEQARRRREFRQALLLWIAFFVLLVLFNGTIPFAFGADLHAWTRSPAKLVPFGFLFYGILFMAVPLVLIKGWETVRRPGFLVPLSLAVLGVTLWHYFPWATVLSVAALVYLHWRFDLSGYGIRSRGRRGDLIAVLVMGVLGLLTVLFQPVLGPLSLGSATVDALRRLFANPASSAENLFYFGFLTERLSYRTGKWLTPLLIALMYTAHEMSNPEYWYGGTSFGFIFVGVAIWAAIYLWRRSAVVIWLGDGLYRFVLGLF